MSQLEMVYLMKVSLHLNTMKDVMKFEKINKKCSTAIQSLKINPWFNNGEDIEKFNKIFEPTTCNCNGFRINNSILLKAERIRNYLFGKLNFEPFFCCEETKPRNEDKIQKKKIIISKLESINTNKIGNDEEFEMLVQNMKPNLKIICDEYFFIEIEQTFRKLQVDLNLYPKQIIINMNNEILSKNIFDLIQKSNQDNIICIWRRFCLYPNEGDLFISSEVKNYFTFIDLEIMEKNKNIVLMLDNEEMNQLSVSPDDLEDKEKRNIYFDLINKICATKIKYYLSNSYSGSNSQSKPQFENEKIIFPGCVKEIIGFSSDNDIHEYKLPFSLEGIEVLTHFGTFEINEKNDLKVLILVGVNGKNCIEHKNESNEKEWGIKNIFDYSPKLTKLNLRDCKYIEILSNLRNLEYLLL